MKRIAAFLFLWCVCGCHNSGINPNQTVTIDQAVAFEFPGGQYTFTLAEVDSGVVLNYYVDVRKALSGVIPLSLDMGNCLVIDSSGLTHQEIIYNDSNQYCRCDVGDCFPHYDTNDVSIGRYSRSVAWTGRNWSGPSDYNAPLGKKFPAGVYTFHVATAFKYQESVYSFADSIRVTLIP